MTKKKDIVSSNAAMPLTEAITVAPFLTRIEAREYVGVGDTTFQQCINELEIGMVSFRTGRPRYAREDMDVVKQFRAEPWRFEELKKLVKHKKNAD